MNKSPIVALLMGILVTLLPDASEAQTRVPGWNRVAPPGGHQNDPQLVRATGGPVVPIFEGWFPNEDGSYQLCFGYFNTNTETVIDIPIGPHNHIEPAEFNGLQPTQFMPQPDGGRRHYCVLSITVPEDWGDRDVRWTLVDELTGQEFASPGRLVHSTYRHDEPLQESRRNSPPKVRLQAEGPVSEGRMGFGRGMVSETLQTRVGEPLELTARVRRDNPWRENDERDIRVRWFKYQGPGNVTFTPDWSSWREEEVGWIDASSWLESDFAYGEESTEAVFSMPGEYIVQVQAYNSVGRPQYETQDFEFWCCWTNAFVRVNVSEGAVSQYGLQAAEPDRAPTFSNEVVRILQEKCQRCHQPGGIGPMPLETYEQVRIWAPLIKENVRRRIMPPWHLDPTIGIQEYKNDFSLSDEQIATLVAWADNGTPEGDRADLPAPVDWPNWLEWELEPELGSPDMVFASGPITVRAEGGDFWPSIDVEWPALEEPRFLKAAEIRNTIQGRAALHHNNVRLNLEEGPSGRVVGAGAGKRWDYFGEDTGILFDVGPGVVNFGAHYFPIGFEFEDNIEVAFWFHPEDDPPETVASVEIHHLVDQFDSDQPRARDILIPPHGTQTMYRTWVLDEPVMLNSYRGHMHLHGIAMSIEVVWPGRVRDYYGPGANRRDVIASINNYNHNWQTSFVFEDDARPILPAGTAIVMRTHFDNTANNPLSIDPDQWVVFGGRSVDAMSHFHVSVTYLEEEEYDSLLLTRLDQLAERKLKNGGYGTALLAIHPDERTRLESGSENVAVSDRSTGAGQYSQQ